MRTYDPTRSRLRRALLAAGAALTLVGATAVTAMGARAAVPPAPDGWSLVWSDDFDGAANTLPSSANWIIDTGTSYPGGPANWGTGEIQTYTNSTANVSLDGAGNLRITPLRDASGRWTSSRIETTRSNFKPPAGGILRIEGRIQMPNVTGAEAAGYWPAFWALGAPYRGNYQNWPGIGEFDIMENVNGVNSVWGVLHCGEAPGGPCNEFNGIGASRACPGSACQSAFHTYRFEWDTGVSPQQLRWYVDGQQFHTVTQSQVGEPHWTNMTGHAGYFILLNVAMGGSFPDGALGSATPTAATIPGRPMVVDYVAVWQTGGGGGPTSPPTSASPTPPGGGTGGGGASAYGRIEAEGFARQSGVLTEDCAEGGRNISGLASGDWVSYPDVAFGATPARTVQARVASGAPGGVSGLIEVRLDDVNSAPVGTFSVANTGGWQSWQTVPGSVPGITGTHDVYLRFTSGQPAEFVNVNWFTFLA